MIRGCARNENGRGWESTHLATALAHPLLVLHLQLKAQPRPALKCTRPHGNRCDYRNDSEVAEAVRFLAGVRGQLERELPNATSKSAARVPESKATFKRLSLDVSVIAGAESLNCNHGSQANTQAGLERQIRGRKHGEMHKRKQPRRPKLTCLQPSGVMTLPYASRKRTSNDFGNAWIRPNQTERNAIKAKQQRT